MAETKYECEDCRATHSIDAAVQCPNCGSKKRKIRTTPTEPISVRGEEVRGKVKDSKGKVATKVLSRTKLSALGKKAKEMLHIDIREDRKIHIVHEEDENGEYKVVHHEDEPLKKKQEKP